MGESMMQDRVLKAISESRRQGGDDFDIVERASIDSMVPRILVKSVYDRLRQEEQQRKAS
jgi:hypothetical protein